MDGESAEEATLFPATVGEKLRGAREAQGLALEDVAQRTRIPQRHLEAIERSDYGGLPSITYALGFAKAYARAVGIDEVGVARSLRTELDRSGQTRPAPVPAYEMTDPMRVPPSGLAWAGVAVALLVLVGAGLYYFTDLFRGSAPAAAGIDAEVAAPPSPTPSPTPAAETGGQVTLVALDTVWLRINDAQGTRIFEKELAPGERYDVPQNVAGVRAKTGRADKIQVLLNGSQVAPLGPGEQTVDVAVGADALRARAGGPDAASTPLADGAAAPTGGPAAPRGDAPVARPRPQPRAPAIAPSPAPVDAAPVAGNASAGAP